MRTGFLVVAMTVIGAASGHAAAFRGVPGAQLYTCAHGPLSRVSTLAARPDQCCDGKLQCPQFLSTTTLLKPKHDLHT